VVTLITWGLHIAWVTPRQVTLYVVGAFYLAACMLRCPSPFIGLQSINSLCVFWAAVYLFLALFIGFNPSALPEVWHFIWRDVAQVQHTTIAMCLLAGALGL
jgi:hypothetical protein